jgi:hypothetical protein
MSKSVSANPIDGSGSPHFVHYHGCCGTFCRNSLRRAGCFALYIYSKIDLKCVEPPRAPLTLSQRSLTARDVLRALLPTCVFMWLYT